jgi:DNA-3-methyladenine glycosylase
MKLPRSFYSRPTLEVAPDLLGKYLVFHSPQGKVVGEINEVEAYLGLNDPASHAFRGKTDRTSVLFGEAGFAYVYFIYGVHYCLNLVTETNGTAGAVLLRSLIPIEGQEIMAKNRGSDKNLTNGPGKICQAFGITKTQNGVDVVQSDTLYLEDRGKKVPIYSTSKRIGISQATDKLWRFFYSTS